MSQENKPVRFIRKNGRIIPIRSNTAKPKQKKVPTADDVAGVLSSASLAGGATYAGVRSYASKFGTKASRLEGMIKRFTPDLPPAKPVAPPTLTKRGKVSKRQLGKGRGMADIFEQADYAKKKSLYASRISKLDKLRGYANNLRTLAGKTRRLALPAALLTGAAAGLATYINND